MLHEFLTGNFNTLADSCRVRVAKRYASSVPPPVVDRGIPQFLNQLIGTLQAEQRTTVRVTSEPQPSPAFTPIGRSATIQGAELLRQGYSVDQVVHYYGDVCQTVTDLAVSHGVPISTDEFRTLNRCLDEAIADAVTAFVEEEESAMVEQASDLHQRLGALAEDQRRLVDIALQTFTALQTGKVAFSGATAGALVNILKELRELIERTLPEIRLLTGMTSSKAETPRKPQQ
ncbi:MAG TPA: sensor histidine kinase, partial [Burkholderiales bacterium]